jgi:phenylalanyl-tRNA synthetase beta chain
MRASYRWIQSLVPGLTASPEDLAARFTAAGLEVEGVEVWGAAARACVVTRVVSTRPHPSRSGLTLVTVDRGCGAPLEVVCGAPNVPGPGGLVVLAPLGASLPAKGVTIERRTIAGVTSEGMLCSEAELGLSDDGAGILVLPPGSAEPGTPLADAIPEAHDTIYEIGLTPNRPDGLGHVGLAREAAALYGLPWSMPRPAPATRLAASGEPTLDRLATVTIDDLDRCPRYCAAAVVDVTVTPSPAWLRYRLAALGVRPISNVVDITNLVLLEYGHPLHAFDLDRVRGEGGREAPRDGVHPIVVRRAHEGESLTTLDGSPHTLTADDLVIADGGGAVALAGVMGGASSEITSSTRRVFLECATFEPRGIRRASRRHGLHTDASHRFERGIDPGDSLDVVTRTVCLLTELALGTAVRGEIDATRGPAPLVVTALRAHRLDALLGVHVPFSEALDILVRLGCTVRAHTRDAADIAVPSHRPDITREVDLIEEVARVRGMDAIPVVLPRVRPSREAAPRETRARRARAAAVELGLSEAVTYSFVSRDALEKLGAPAASVVLRNPLSVEQEVMRTSLLPGLLEAVARARRHGERDARLFTVGSVFLEGPEAAAAGEPRLPEERLLFAAILAGERAPYLGKPEPVDVWDAKGLAEGFARRMTGGATIAVERFSDAGLAPHLHPRGAARVTVQGAVVGSLGPLHPDVVERFDLGADAVVVEMDLAALDACSRTSTRYAVIPRFPASTRDLALVVHDDIAAGDVEAAVRRAAGALATEVTLFDRFVGGAIPDGHRSLAFRIVYRAEDHTLTDAEVDARHARAVAEVNERFGATLRR